MNKIVPFNKTMTRLLWLVCLTLGALAVCAVIVSFLIDPPDTSRLRVATVLQNVMVFIFPAIAVALMSSKTPDIFLSLRRLPSLVMTLLAVLLLVVSVPFQNCIIEWNASLSLPSSLSALEEYLKSAEERAQSSIEMTLGGASIADLIMGILIVGILTGFSEELLFRGALMRILSRRSTCITHSAVWLTALIFSLVHFQFYGFVPRLLLGALFGYVVMWSGSLWLSALLHALNNSAVVVSRWVELRNGATEVELADTVGPTAWPWVLASIIATAIAIWYMQRLSTESTSRARCSVD